jgi:hypothetical protein
MAEFARRFQGQVHDHVLAACHAESVQAGREGRR